MFERRELVKYLGEIDDSKVLLAFQQYLDEEEPERQIGDGYGMTDTYIGDFLNRNYTPEELASDIFGSNINIKGYGVFMFKPCEVVGYFDVFDAIDDYLRRRDKDGKLLKFLNDRFEKELDKIAAEYEDDDE